VRLTPPPSASRLPIQCGILTHLTALYASRDSYGDSFNLLYLDDVRTSQDTQVRAYIACYGDTFTFLCVVSIQNKEKTNQLTKLHKQWT
jgi:hypothetical protein